MTDKVQKIREEIEKKLEVMQYQVHRKDAYKELKSILDYIDSLQEEPVSSIWHNASEKSNKPENVVIINPFDNTGEVLTKCVDVYQGHIWAYTSELLKLYNLCKIGKNLQEEPVSEFLNTESMIESYKQRLISQANGMKNSPLIDMCLVSYKHGINETLDALKLSNVQKTVKNWKEPVSEELEEASKNYALNNTPWDDCKDEIQEAFKAGAKWKKARMMLNTIDATCFGFQGAALFSFRLPVGSYLVGSEVKVIVVKND